MSKNRPAGEYDPLFDLNAPAPLPVPDPPHVQFACPSCGSAFLAPRSSVGKKAVCSKCGQKVQIPNPPANKTALGVPQQAPVIAHEPPAKTEALDQYKKIVFFCLVFILLVFLTIVGYRWAFPASLDKYNRIDNGMVYEDVVRIMGSPGKEIPSEGQTTRFAWYNLGGANMNVTFYGRVVVNKAQSGLR